MKHRLCLVGLLALVAFAGTASAGTNTCDPGEAPDIILGSIYNLNNYGGSGGMRAFSIGTESCNVGTCWAEWLSGSPGLHPVIGQNLFRYKDGRFEHIGQSWLKHGFATLDLDLCGSCNPSDGQHLGVNCSDPYSANLNGSQGNLGPKFEVNAKEGTHLHPFTAQGQSGGTTYKRIQAAETDLDPTLNPGAVYYVEGQYVTHDDVNNFNNNSYRQVNVNASMSLQLTGPTLQETAAIYAWQVNDPAVVLKEVDNEYIGGARVTDLGNGWWHYEYAVQNLISHISGQAVEVPIPRGAQIANIGFHAPEYHSGEPYSNIPWTATIDTASSPNKIRWEGETYAENENANALRWGSMYNFRFDANVGPTNRTTIEILPFRPGGQNRKFRSDGPERCGDSFCDPDENAFSCAIDCADLGDAGQVPNGDDVPGDMLLLDLQGGGDILMTWDDSCLVADADFEVYEGSIGNYASHVSKECTTGGLTNTTITPEPGNTYYLIVPSNGDREGSYGQDSSGNERPQGATSCQPQSVGTCPL